MTSALRYALILVLIAVIFPSPVTASTHQNDSLRPPRSAASKNGLPFPPRSAASKNGLPFPPYPLPTRPAASPGFAAANPGNCGAGVRCIFLPEIMQPKTGQASPNGRAYAVSLYNTAYLGSAGVPAGWNGNIAACKAGTTSQAFQNAVFTRINYYREMAGIPKLLGIRSDYDQQDQEAALIMAANQSINHTPPSTWRCYTSAGAAGAGSSNLAMGTYGPDAITLYMSEQGSLGHRRWLLYPQTQEIGTGDVPGSGGWQTVTNALKAWDDHVWDPRPATRDAFVAWPPPGYVPYQVVYPAWSFAVAGADFSQASVTLTSNGASIPVTVSQTDNGYGENTLAWNACSGCGSWPNPGADRAYQVAVKNVMVNGAPHNYSYTVTVIDPAK